MKRVKLLLTAIAILAIAGGVFAFNTKFNRKVCTAAYQNGCPPHAQILRQVIHIIQGHSIVIRLSHLIPPIAILFHAKRFPHP